MLCHYACLMALFVAVGCGDRADSAAEPVASTAIDARLLLVISVDQMRADYLERFDEQLTGGLRRLIDEGAVFAEARQSHAVTSTAPGHAAILSGMYPRDNGIVDNAWYDHALGRRERAAIDPDYRIVGAADDGPGVSPRQFIGSSLVGWLKQRDPGSQAVSISRKARTAVLTAPEAEHVYWWHGSGNFVTSTFYGDSLPQWVADFNDGDWLTSYAGASWELLEAESAYAASQPDDRPGESRPRGYGNVFPHPLPEERRALASRIQTSPFMDQATLDLGRAAVDALELGADDVADVLVLGLSSTDSIGHAFGPYSREIHDQMLRLDRMLGEFFDFVDATVGLDRTLIVLTSDHGVVPVPEYSRELGEDAERLRMNDVIDGIDEVLAWDYEGDDWFASYSYGWLQLDREQARDRGADADELIARAQEYIASLDYVAAVFSRAELLSDEPLDSPYDALARRSFYPDRSGDLYVIHQPLSLWQAGAAANHQSPHDYDQHVPLVLRHPSIPAGRRSAPAAIIDLAPTLAMLYDVEPSEPLEGTLLPGF